MIPPRDPKSAPAKTATPAPEPVWDDETTKPTGASIEDAITQEMLKRETTPGPAD